LLLFSGGSLHNARVSPSAYPLALSPPSFFYWVAPFYEKPASLFFREQLLYLFLVCEHPSRVSPFPFLNPGIAEKFSPFCLREPHPPNSSSPDVCLRFRGKICVDASEPLASGSHPFPFAQAVATFPSLAVNGFLGSFYRPTSPLSFPVGLGPFFLPWHLNLLRVRFSE